MSDWPDTAVLEVSEVLFHWPPETGRPTTLVLNCLLVTRWPPGSHQKMTRVSQQTNQPDTAVSRHSSGPGLFLWRRRRSRRRRDELEREGMSQLMLLLPVWWSVQTITMTITKTCHHGERSHDSGGHGDISTRGMSGSSLPPHLAPCSLIPSPTLTFDQ